MDYRESMESPSLSQALRAGTRDAHVRAERMPFVQRILRKTVVRADYAAYLRSLAEVYQALEERLGEAPAWLQGLHPRELYRTPALESDLQVLDPEAAAEPVAAAEAAGRRIRELPETHVLAQAYVRYLGDLSGGQALAPLVEDALDLRGGAGSAFYRFPGIDPRAFKASYREGLDGLPLDPHQQQEVVEEAVRAFQEHESIFRELEEGAEARTREGLPS